MDDLGKKCTDLVEKSVAILAERIALLHYAFVRTLIDELGEVTAEELTKRAIRTYGTLSGKRTEERVRSLGLPPVLENFQKGGDLPAVGWKKSPCPIPEGLPGGSAGKVEYCPLAKHWKDLGFERWGRLYCGVDQAKYEAYGKGYTCVHDRNMLDGDDFCIVRVERGEEGLEELKQSDGK